MIVQVVTVHPSVTVVSAADRQFEIPTESFPTPPQAGQTWNLSLTHLPTSAEQVEKLNDYLTSA